MEIRNELAQFPLKLYIKSEGSNLLVLRIASGCEPKSQSNLIMGSGNSAKESVALGKQEMRSPTRVTTPNKYSS